MNANLLGLASHTFGYLSGGLHYGRCLEVNCTLEFDRLLFVHRRSLKYFTHPVNPCKRKLQKHRPPQVRWFMTAPNVFKMILNKGSKDHKRRANTSNRKWWTTTATTKTGVSTSTFGGSSLQKERKNRRNAKNLQPIWRLQRYGGFWPHYDTCDNVAGTLTCPVQRAEPSPSAEFGLEVPLAIVPNNVGPPSAKLARDRRCIKWRLGCVPDNPSRR